MVQTDKIDKTDPLHPDKKPIEHRPSWVHDATKYKFEYIHWDEAAVARFEQLSRRVDRMLTHIPNK